MLTITVTPAFFKKNILRALKRELVFGRLFLRRISTSHCSRIGYDSSQSGVKKNN